MAAESELQERFFKQAGAVVSAAYDAAMKGGEVQAFVRQGFGELGAALKAFPDAIQVEEPGAVFSPLYSDIAADKRARASEPEAPAKGNRMSPGDIAGRTTPGPVRGETQEADRQALPSPSEIASDQQPYRPSQDRGQQHGQDHGRGI